MTVIAYSSKHKIMAADSRLSDEHAMHFANGKKVFRLKNGALLGTGGDSDSRDVRTLLSKATPRRLPTRAELAALKCEFIGILVFPKGQVYVIEIEWLEHDAEGEWMASVDPVADEIIAVGHGQQFAYGAMEMGADPRRAVQITCRRDTTCALPLQWEKL